MPQQDWTMPRPFPPTTPLFGWAMLLLVVLYMTISPLALVEFGLNYEETGGTPLEKIHPGTFLAALILFAALAATGDPIGWLAALAHRQPAVLAYLVLLALLVFYSIFVVKLPFTPLIDTFFAPLLVLLLVQNVPAGRGRTLALLLHVLMVVNAVAGIIEFATGTRITPLVAGGVIIDDDWRSSALLGHPLANASLTGTYLICLTLGGGKDLNHWLRIAAYGLNLAGMVVFGGRAATVLLLIMLGLLLAIRLVGIARGARFSRHTILIGLVSVPLIALAIVVLTEAGFFDQFIQRFIDDKGSAETRAEMFELFRHLSLYEFVFGPDARHMETLRAIYGLDFGIESFWVSSLLAYGLLASLLLFTAVFLLCREIVRVCRPGALWVLIFFFAVASTSVSLSAKSPLLAVLVLMLVVLLRPQPSAYRRAPPTRPAPDAAVLPVI